MLTQDIFFPQKLAVLVIFNGQIDLNNYKHMNVVDNILPTLQQEFMVKNSFEF